MPFTTDRFWYDALVVTGRLKENRAAALQSTGMLTETTRCLREPRVSMPFLMRKTAVTSSERHNGQPHKKRVTKNAFGPATFPFLFVV